jgi:hypothetical protein
MQDVRRSRERLRFAVGNFEEELDLSCHALGNWMHRRTASEAQLSRNCVHAAFFFLDHVTTSVHPMRTDV